MELSEVKRQEFLMKTKPLPQQNEMIGRMVKKKALILVGKTGIGKSFCTLSTFVFHYNKNHVDSMLILAPRNAYDKGVWKEEIQRHTNIPYIDIETFATKTGLNLTKIKLFLERYPVIVCKHTHVHVYADLMKLIQVTSRCMAVFDECHKYKNASSRLTVATRLVMTKAFVKIGLTATPLSKDMKDCYNLVNFIKPWYLGTFDAFKKEFCVVNQKVIGRAANGALRKVDEIVGIASEQALKQRLFPIVVTSESHHSINWHYIDYEMDEYEKSIYRRLSVGLFNAIKEEKPEDWFKRVLTQEQQEEKYSIKEVSRYSSRFLYLQFAADGIVSEDGSLGNREGVKIKKALDLLSEIFSRGESVVIYCDYYASMTALMKAVGREFPNVRLLESSGKVTLKENDMNEAMVKRKPHALFITRAGSESNSLYYINNVILFNCPTLPSAFVQSVGRINRVNTLFPGNLHAYIFRSDNIDLYKLMIVSKKTALSETVVNEEANVPKDYKDLAKQMDDLAILKKYLLWNQDQSLKVRNLLDVQ